MNRPTEAVTLTLVFTICNLRGLRWGWSAAPTNASSDVQNNISTIPRAPSSTQPSAWTHSVASMLHTHGIYPSEGIAIRDAVPFPSTDGDASTEMSRGEYAVVGDSLT